MKAALVREISESFLHWFFPHNCAGCGNHLSSGRISLCIRCTSRLPETGFAPLPGNPVEKLFYGRLPLVAATAQFHFTANSLMQQLMHEFKYNGNEQLGLQLAEMLGRSLRDAGRFFPEAVIPVPLFKSKLKKRGYNQAAVTARGIASVLSVPVYENALLRIADTPSQTRKSRTERWQNMEGRFRLNHTPRLEQHILLVDDVVTTGATLESCAGMLLEAGYRKISIATLGISYR